MVQPTSWTSRQREGRATDGLAVGLRATLTGVTLDYSGWIRSEYNEIPRPDHGRELVRYT